MAIEEALNVIEAASTGSLGEVCIDTTGFKSLPAGVALDPRRYDTARQKADMSAMMLQNLGAAETTRRNGKKIQFWEKKKKKARKKPGEKHFKLNFLHLGREETGIEGKDNVDRAIYHTVCFRCSVIC